MNQTPNDVPIIPAIELYLQLPWGVRSDGKTINCAKLKPRYEFENVLPRVKQWKKVGWVDYYNDQDVLDYFEFEMVPDIDIVGYLLGELQGAHKHLLTESFYFLHYYNGEWIGLQERLFGAVAMFHGLQTDHSIGHFCYPDHQSALDGMHRYINGERLTPNGTLPPGDWVKYKGPKGDVPNPLR